MERATKLRKLKSHLRRMGSVVLAYSGGVDSTFLLKVASDVLGRRTLAVTAVSETYPSSELREAKATAAALGTRHRVIRTSEFKDPSFRKNPLNRCYYCKRELFARLRSLAQSERLPFVIDGSNTDDQKDFRPGTQAKKELGVVSPLQEAGLSKADIRVLSKKIGLTTWKKPALACLASRIPYHSRITKKRLQRVEAAEEALRKAFSLEGNIRVRDFGDRAKIEVDRPHVKRLTVSGQTVSLLRACGFKKVAIDKKGYRTGSMNEGLKGK